MLKFYKSKYIISSGDKIYENSVLVVKDGKISDIIKNDEVPENAEVFDYGNAVITPGFVNLHTHLQYTDLELGFKPGYTPENINFSDWVISLMKQYYSWSEEKKIKSLKNGLKEAVLSGCTCIAQLSKEEFVFDILNNLDLKSFVFLETFSNSEENSEKEIKKLKEQIKKYTSQNVTVGISPHSVYNVHKSLWEKIAEFAATDDILIHTHLAESPDEINWLNNKPSGIDKIHEFVGWNKLNPYISGLNPVEYLEKLEVLSKLKENLTSAHCTELDEKSLEKLINYGTKIAHCPRSNMLLHGKTLNLNKLPEIISENTGLGTDSRFSNYDLSILNEAKFVKDYTNSDFKNIINMLTINSARILKIDDKTGSLEKGKDADFLVFKLSGNENYRDILNPNILNKEKPDDIFINGKLTVKNGKFTSEYNKLLNE